MQMDLEEQIPGVSVVEEIRSESGFFPLLSEKTFLFERNEEIKTQKNNGNT